MRSSLSDIEGRNRLEYLSASPRWHARAAPCVAVVETPAKLSLLHPNEHRDGRLHTVWRPPKMYLLNVHTYRLKRFIDERSAPSYAILSHMWSDGKEVQHTDMLKHSFDERDNELDWKKIDFTCKQAIADGLEYAWIDTCCIDKSSSAELSEAINSMFRWYRGANVCYAYMADVGVVTVVPDNGEGTETSPDFVMESGTEYTELSAPVANREPLTSPFRQSRWFTRGWTLQELLAPSAVVFYDCDWRPLGDRTRLLPDITVTTGISSDVLKGHMALKDVGIATRMSWASQRRTTRLEDEAYCLLGIFDVNMPLLYGEGQKAFTRLQEEIMKVSRDHTIFAWNGPESQLLAPSPANFADSGTIVPRDLPDPDDVCEMTNRGCRMSLTIDDKSFRDGLGVAVLDCVDLRAPNMDVCLPLSANGAGKRPLLHAEPKAHVLLYHSTLNRHHDYVYRSRGRWQRRQLLVQRYAQDKPQESTLTIKFVLKGVLANIRYRTYPEGSWDEETCTSTVRANDYHQVDELGGARAVWVGTAREPRSQRTTRRFKQWFVRPHGLVVAWVTPDTLPWDSIAFSHKKCGHRAALQVATQMLERLRPWSERSTGKQDVFPTDSMLNFQTAEFNVSFGIEPIGMHRNGLTVIVNYDEKDKISRWWRLLAPFYWPLCCMEL